MGTHRSVYDGWFARRVMKLTPGERRWMNSPRHARHTERTALALFEHIELPPQPTCLEIGCGQGALARLLVERFDARVIATDCDPDQVAVAQARLADLDGKVDFRVVDARAMPFDDAQFDAVFSFGVLHHILRGWRQAVAETARVLKPNGWFVLTDIVAADPVDRLIRRLLPRWDLFGEPSLHACLDENGLHLEHYQRDPDRHTIGLGLMSYCVAVARLNR
ncbi:MAG: class I SAM-dependent methyltransferase [Anaerolineae bacterium]